MAFNDKNSLEYKLGWTIIFAFYGLLIFALIWTFAMIVQEGNEKRAVKRAQVEMAESIGHVSKAILGKKLAKHNVQIVVNEK